MSSVDPPTLGRRFSAISLVLAPLFLPLSAIPLPSSASEPGPQTAAVNVHHRNYYPSVLRGLAGRTAPPPALHPTSPTAPPAHRRLGVIGGGLALFGSMLALVDWGGELVKWQMGVPGADRAQMVALVARFDETASSAFVTQLSGLTFLVGIVGLAVGLRRGHVAPLWVSLGLVAGTFLNLVGFAVGKIVLLDASGVILLPAMASIAWHSYITAVASHPASDHMTLGLNAG